MDTALDRAALYYAHVNYHDLIRALSIENLLVHTFSCMCEMELALASSATLCGAVYVKTPAYRNSFNKHRRDIVNIADI